MTRRDRFGQVLLIGLDSAVPGRWRRYAEAGDLPVGRRLLAKGAFAAECLPTFPTLTTTNWATIATGAWPGTHGIVDFNPHRPGDEIGVSLQGFDARDVTAEFVWEAAIRARLETIVVNWPGSWPPREAQLDAGPVDPEVPPAGAEAAPGLLTLVGGAGIELNEWRIGLPGMGRRVAIASEQRFSTRGEPGSSLVTLPANGAPFQIRLAFDDAFEPVLSPVTLTGQVMERHGGHVVRFGLADDGPALAELAAGDWSGTLELPLSVGGGVVQGLFRLKLQDLDLGAGLFRLYVTDICRHTWLEEPAGAVGDTSHFAGLPTPGVGWDSLGSGCIDLETFVELTGMATAWLADVCAALLTEQPWRLFCVHLHAIDSFYHLCSAKLAEHLTPDAAERRRYEAAEVAIYRQLDDSIGRMLEAAGGSALTVLVSDHGAKPAGVRVPLRRILADAGLLAEVASAAGEGGTNDGGGAAAVTQPAIDWDQTLAAPQGSCYVRVNLAGRDPGGLVTPVEFHEVRTRAMRAMLDYCDPQTGACPFSLVVPAEEAVSLGLFGDGVGDIVYAVHEKFADEHGQVLPGSMCADGAWGMRSLCVFSGAGIRPGSVIDEPFSLIDVAPTVCDALGIPPPLQADGRSLLQLLSTPESEEEP